MTDTPDADDGTLRVASDLALALALLRASDTLYRDVLTAIGRHVGSDGDADIPSLVADLNRLLTAFAPRDREIRRLLGALQG